MTIVVGSLPSRITTMGQPNYAWSLLATHAVVWLFFADTGALRSITAAVEPYCWPYFENCWSWRLPSETAAQAVLFGYLAIGLLAGVALGHDRHRLAWLFLVALNVYLFGVVSLDYRLRGNEFYMLFWVNAAFLVSPRSKWMVPLTIVCCYFWAGVLKINTEWLSGSGLYYDLWMVPEWLTPWACAYVIALEMVMIWGLMASRTSVAVLVLFQLVLFHLQSLSQIHWFYPLLMAAILSWFVLDRASPPASGAARLSTLLNGRAPRSAYSLLALFAAMQLARYTFPGDPALTGQGRVFALHMFEARQECQITAFLPPTGERLNLKVETLSPRMICDPVVYFNRAQNLCRSRRSVDAAFDFRLLMQSKRTTDAQFVNIIDEPKFCSSNYSYRLLRDNDWLR